MAWNPQDYHFEPYELQAQRLPSSSGLGTSDNVRKKGGRQRRSSILCQVEGCGAELIKEKTYYKRYRICMAHCNMKSMVIQGRRQRFCQQCGRFHEIGEFEGTRKSCRRKLERHNQRRRTLPAKGCGWQSDSEDDEAAAGAGDDAEYQVLANIKRGARSRSVRQGSLAPAERPLKGQRTTNSPCSSMDVFNNCSMETCEPSSAVPTRVVPQGPMPSTSLQAPSQAAYGPISSSDASARSSPAIHLAFSGEIPSVNAPASGLLPDILTNDGVLDEALMLFPEDPSDSLVVSRDAQMTNSKLPAASAGTTAEVNVVPDALDSWLHAPTFNLYDLASPRGSQPQPMQFEPQYQQAHYRAQMIDTPFLAGPSSAQAAAIMVPRGLSRGSSALEAAAGMVSLEGAPLINYTADETLMRLSIKLFNCTPDMLVPSIKCELVNLLRVAEQSLIEGYVRPGCLHLTIDARVPVGESAVADRVEGLAASVERLLKSGALSSAAAESMIVQLQKELVMVKQGRVMAAVDTTTSAGVMPRIDGVLPLAVVAGQRRTLLKLQGARLNEPEALIMCRQGGHNLVVEYLDDMEDEEGELALTPARENTRVDTGPIEIGVLGLAAGCAEIEVQVGSFLGPSKPLLVLPDATAVAEVRQLENASRRTALGIPTENFLRDVGLVSQYLERATAAEQGRPVPTYTPFLLRRIGNLACKLVAVSAARGWAALAAYLLPATIASGQSSAAAAAQMDAACPPGSTLLHVAVGTGSVRVVHALLSWADKGSAGSNRAFWAVDTRGVAGVTPLHVAALLPAKIRAGMRLELAAASPAVEKLWGLTQSDDGTTPEALAEMMAGGPLPGALEPSEAGKVTTSSRAIVTRTNPVGLVSPLLNWKSRNDVKAQLMDSHINNLMEEVCTFPPVEPSPNAWEVGTMFGGAVVGSAVAMALGILAAVLGRDL